MGRESVNHERSTAHQGRATGRVYTDMNCVHCGASNRLLEHRCHRCARRLLEETEFQYAPAALSALGRVVDGESLSLVPSYGVAVAEEEEEPGGRHRGTTLVQYAGVEESVEWQPVRFYAPALSPRRAPTASLEAVIECDARVAVPVHRMLASALDAGLVLASFGPLLAALVLCGVEIVLNRETIPVYVAMGLAVKVLYDALWCLAGADTFGMQMTGARLMTLDGRTPSAWQRVGRSAARLVSLGAAGLGFLWALCDEESLCWHDHVSGTFVSAVPRQR